MAQKKTINILVKYISIKKRFDFLLQDKNVKNKKRNKIAAHYFYSLKMILSFRDFEGYNFSQNADASNGFWMMKTRLFGI